MRSAWVAVIILSCCFAFSGCGPGNAGTGGTGELVAPRQALRDVESATMNEIGTPAASQPADAGPTTRPSTMPAKEVELTVEQVRAAALGNNLTLKVELLSPTIARESLHSEQAAFESVFTASANYFIQDEPGFAGADLQQLAGNQSKTFSLTPGMRVPLRSGGSINMDLPFTRFQPKDAGSGPDATYSSDAAFSLSQPLLRGGGTYVNTQGIRAAFYQYQQSEAQTKLQVITTLVNADRAYWRLYAALRLLEVREKEYQLASAQLERAQRQVRAQTVGEVEVVRAEAGVADAIQNIINSRTSLDDRNRELKRILNMPGLEMETPTLIIPISQPNAVYFQVDQDRLISTALQKRMELLETELQLALDASNVTVARNGMLPLLSFDYQYRINGFGPAPVETFEVLGDKDFENHSLGLRLEVPIGNEQAKARLRQALARRLQTIATKSQRIETVTFEVLGAAQNLEAAFQRILAARRRVILDTRLADQEVRQYNLGLRTSTDVLQAQAELANAQSTEIAAITEYQIAQVDIAFATGMVLGASKVTWEPATAPRK